jgi:hypothetical protein
MFNPASVGFPLNPQFDRNQLQNLLARFRAAVCREQDKSLAARLENEFLVAQPPAVERDTFHRLAKWCNTDGNPYQHGMEVAKQISLLLFGQILDRKRIGV